MILFLFILHPDPRCCMRFINDDPDRKRRRQAEFLVHRNFDWNLVEEIAVLSQLEKNRVGAILNAAVHKPPIHILPDWYY